MFAELLGRSCFSFLDGGSHPAELLQRASELGLPALGLCDHGGFYGLARAFAEESRLAQGPSPVRLIPGAELAVRGPGGLSTVAFLVASREGYETLSRLVTRAHRDVPKGRARLPLDALPARPTGLFALLPSPYDEAVMGPVVESFGERAFVAVHRHLVGDDLARRERACRLAARLDVELVATARPLYHLPERRVVHDVLTCIRLGVTLEDAGPCIGPNAQAFLRGETEVRHLFRETPAWVDRTGEIASACGFSMGALGYRFPSSTLRPGETPDEGLRRAVCERLPWRYPEGPPPKVLALLEKELAVIEKLRVASYFLATLEIVDIARGKGILCQGRGSAANSAVCFVLGITSVDPARAELLFERFLSEERGEPPDIDVDFEHERREEVIQEIYRRYGRERAAMVSEVIRFRARSAVREVGKVFGLSEEVTSRVARALSWREQALSDERLIGLGLDPREPTLRETLRVAALVQGFPRHLSVHVGGFVLSDTSLLDVAPIEPAAMDGRSVVQWDKDDLDTLGFFKVDVLALGMLTAIQRALALLHDPARGPFDAHAALARIPAEDPRVYARFCRADTVGVFQIESRAQRVILPALQPRAFYDLVVEVAIVRPGPIQGGMVHPYIRRRRGEEPVTFPHPRLRPVLERTLGIPLFQEQVMQLAIVGAGYTGGEADELRRDMAAWRRSGQLLRHRERLLRGFARAGISAELGEALFLQILGFGEYGFPESHAASFALLVYASGWLKAHAPAAFLCALLNAQPMGFYGPSALVQDAQRHGVRVRPVSVLRSGWDSTLERDRDEPEARSVSVLRSGWDSTLERDRDEPAVRLGLRQVRGLPRALGARIVEARAERPFVDLDDFVVRSAPGRRELDRLAEAGALEGLAADRRDALWRSRAPRAPGLFRERAAPEAPASLPRLSAFEQLSLDYEHTGLSLTDHPIRHLRVLARSRAPRLVTARELAERRHRSLASVVGLVESRQRPATASGVVFVTLEDETGGAQIILWSRVFDRFRHEATTAQILLVHGIVERTREAVHLIAERIEAWDRELPVRSVSRDFR